ncbi:Acetyl-CoA carboxylase 2 [Camellia lanceoleosa]|uniref:Acetyl-CoA carboxylase 2 n=1 Tax=Camellia lanceoleosa TaxID=1840588 RepID=A0ACC0IYT3_9ERIC|nr:Acetyl-CoA carboxylase 2 [Camellia lanceoleosa]
MTTTMENAPRKSVEAMGGHDDSGSSEKKSIGVVNDVPTFNVENMQNNMKAVYYWQYYQVLQQQPNFVHQFYNEAGTMLRIDGNSRETATAMLNDHDPSKLVAETPCELLRGLNWFLLFDSPHLWISVCVCVCVCEREDVGSSSTKLPLVVAEL